MCLLDKSRPAAPAPAALRLRLWAGGRPTPAHKQRPTGRQCAHLARPRLAGGHSHGTPSHYGRHCVSDLRVYGGAVSTCPPVYVGGVSTAAALPPGRAFGVEVRVRGKPALTWGLLPHTPPRYPYGVPHKGAVTGPHVVPRDERAEAHALRGITHRGQSLPVGHSTGSSRTREG